MVVKDNQKYGLFCIEIDFEKNSESPSRVFRTMSELIDTFEFFDKDLVRSIDPRIETIALIENIETGSIKAWLANKLLLINDDALKNLDWKPQVGQYLVRAKYFTVSYLQGKTQISTKEQIEELEKGILDIAIQTDVTHVPAYSPPNRAKLLENVKKISNSLQHLHPTDKAFYRTREDRIEMNKEFSFVPESIEQLITRETLVSKHEMIFKVKKPDYLGESRWDLRHGNRVISVKIKDVDWLERFQQREIDVRPGDSLRAETEISYMYGYDNEVVNSLYEIAEVKEVLPAKSENQLSLEPPDNTEDGDS